MTLRHFGIIIAIAVTTLLSKPLLADVVFIDANNAPQEIAAARRAAASLGERFHVITGGGLNAQEAVRRMAANSELRNAASIRLVVSGHRRRDEFFGENGSIDLPDFSEGLAQNGLRAKVSTVLFAGCYQTNEGSAVRNQTLWPEALVVGGWTPKSPTREQTVMHRLIYSFMAESRRIEQARSAQEAQQILRRLDGWSNVNACVVRGQYITNSRITSVDELRRRCPSAVQLSGHEDYVNCIYNFQPRCGDVPPVEVANRGPLRQHYEHLIRTEICDDMLPYGTRIGQRSALALVFDRNIRQHLERNFADELPALDRALTQFGVPSNTLLSGFSRLPRHEIMRRIQDAEAYLRLRCANAAAPKFCGDREFPEYNWALSRLDAIRRVYIDPASCQPGQWIDPAQGAHVADTCDARASGSRHRREAELAAAEEASSKYLVNQVAAVEDRVRPYIEQMKNAYPAGGSPDVPRLQQLNQDYERAVQIMVNELPALGDAINSETQRLQQISPAWASEYSRTARETIARRYAAYLRDRYGAPPLPNTTN